MMRSKQTYIIPDITHDLTLSVLQGLVFSASRPTLPVTALLLKLGLLSCLSTRISRLMYELAEGDFCRGRCCSSALTFFFFPDSRPSQTLPSLVELVPFLLLTSVAEFLRFRPDRSEPTPPEGPPPAVSVLEEEFLRRVDLEPAALVPIPATRPALLLLG